MAVFALGYWAGCRVSDISWLRIEHTHIGPKVGWLHVGYKGGKARDIDLINAARRPMYEYIHHGGRDPESSYTFTSQRSERQAWITQGLNSRQFPKRNLYCSMQHLVSGHPAYLQLI